MAQGSFKKSGGAPKMKGKAGRGNVAAKSRRLVNKGKTAVKKGCECLLCLVCGVALLPSLYVCSRVMIRC